LIFQNANPDETVSKFVELGVRHVENLRRVTRQIKDAQVDRDNDALKRALKEYDDCLEKYIPVLMAEAHVYWNKEDYDTVER